jgi:acyl CoA:acetate/3-ketoacid CoA transferase beta subunit
MSEFTIDELISVCIARQVVDGEVLAQGLNTPLVMAGFILAHLTHAPNAKFGSAIGQSICTRWSPLGILRQEDAWMENGLLHPGFVVAALDLLPKFNPKEFFRPAQIDRHGNTNNVAFGRDMSKPRMRLPGTGGIPDVTVYSEQVYFYVPRHSPITFVERLDCMSGMGESENRVRGLSPRYLVTDLGQFDWAHGLMRITHLHPDVTLEQVRRRTGFPLGAAPDLRETDPPSAEELRLLRDVIDPLGVRRLEILSGSARKDLLREILEKETYSPSTH